MFKALWYSKDTEKNNFPTELLLQFNKLLTPISYTHTQNKLNIKRLKLVHGHTVSDEVNISLVYLCLSYHPTLKYFKIGYKTGT